MRTRVLDAIVRGAVEEAVGLLRAGALVGFPTETVYGLGANAFRTESVERIFAVKGRPAGKPLMLHVDGAEMARAVVRWSDAAEELARAFWPGPLTLVLPPARAVAEALLGPQGGVAVRAPAHAVALDLIRTLGSPVAGTSANRSGRPSPTTAADVLADLDGVIEAVLDAGPVPLGIESTVVDLTGPVPLLLRPGAVPAREIEPLLPGLALAATARQVGGMEVVAAGGKPIPFILFSGATDRVRREVVAEAARLAQAGKRVGFLGSQETARLLALAGVVVEPLGPADRPADWGLRLFAGLRALGAAGVDVILVDEPEAAPAAEAVVHRLRRAASEVRRME